MLALGYVQQSKHFRLLNRYWISALPVQKDRLRQPSSGHTFCYNSVTLIRLKVLLLSGLSAHHLHREAQVLAGGLVTTAGLHRKSGYLKSGRQGRREISAKRQKQSRGRESELFEEWLKANPLPGSLLTEGSQGGENCPTLHRYEPGSKEFRPRSGRMAGEECDDAEMLAERMLVMGQDRATLKKLEASSVLLDNSTDPAKHNGLKRGENGPQHKREFSWEETGDVLYECLCDCDELAWDCEKRSFLEVNQSRRGWRIEFTPPLILPPLSSCCTPTEYLQSLHRRRGLQGNKQLLALLSSNAAALAIFNDGKFLLHKVITGYTVRAKQGKSQLKYLREGGPGRMTVGGAIRARETERFFSRVCEKLDEWSNEIQDCELLFFSGTTRVWNEVYAADDSKILVSRNDSRWCKVPFSVYEPRFREIQRVFYRLSHGTVGYTCQNEQQP